MNHEELVAAMAEAVAGHDFDVADTPVWTITCRGCDWRKEGGELEDHDAHRAELELNAVEHLIRADALTTAAYQIDRDGPANVIQWLCDRAEELEKRNEGMNREAARQLLARLDALAGGEQS